MKERTQTIKAVFGEDIVRLAIILLFIIVMSIASPYFLTVRNMMNILQNISLQGITAIGMTMVIITAIAQIAPPPAAVFPFIKTS